MFVVSAVGGQLDANSLITEFTFTILKFLRIKTYSYNLIDHKKGVTV